MSRKTRGLAWFEEAKNESRDQPRDRGAGEEADHECSDRAEASCQIIANGTPYSESAADSEPDTERETPVCRGRGCCALSAIFNSPLMNEIRWIAGLRSVGVEILNRPDG